MALGGGCRESVLVAAAKQICRRAGLRQHVGEGLVDDAVARELPGAEPRRLGARDRLDQIAARGAEPRREPEREAVRGEPPGALDIGASGDRGIRRPDRPS